MQNSVILLSHKTVIVYFYVNTFFLIFLLGLMSFPSTLVEKDVSWRAGVMSSSLGIFVFSYMNDLLILDLKPFFFFSQQSPPRSEPCSLTFLFSCSAMWCRHMAPRWVFYVLAVHKLACYYILGPLDVIKVSHFTTFFNIYPCWTLVLQLDSSIYFGHSSYFDLNWLI